MSLDPILLVESELKHILITTNGTWAFTETLPVCHPSHHVVDLLDSQTDISGLQACGEVGLQQGSVVNSLVEVVALNLWSVLWYGVSVSVDIPR